MVIGGIRVKFNPLLLVMLALSLIFGLFGQLLRVFLLILLHECAHVLCAKCVGIKTVRLDVMLFGAGATFSVPIEQYPQEEFLVAIAGPMFNILLACGLNFVLRYFPQYAHNLSPWIEDNLLLALFNLLPALPLDGGRMLRAILSHHIPLNTASKITAVLGVLFGVGLGTFGIHQWVRGIASTLPPLCLFLLFSAITEWLHRPEAIPMQILHHQERMANAHPLPVRQIAVYGHARLHQVARMFQVGYYHTVLVLDESGNTVAQLSEQQLLQAMQQYGAKQELKRLPFVRLPKPRTS